MKKVRKKVIGILVVLLMGLLMCNMSVMAADDRLGMVVDGSLLTDSTEVSGNTHNLLRGTYLSYGYGSVQITGTRSLLVSGATNCYRTADKVRVTLYLERLVGSTWKNVETLPTKTAYDSTYVSTSKTYSVTGGYYYRVKGAHVAIKGSTTESTTSYSDGIWVS